MSGNPTAKPEPFEKVFMGFDDIGNLNIARFLNNTISGASVRGNIMECHIKKEPPSLLSINNKRIFSYLEAVYSIFCDDTKSYEQGFRLCFTYSGGKVHYKYNFLGDFLIVKMFEWALETNILCNVDGWKHKHNGGVTYMILVPSKFISTTGNIIHHPEIHDIQNNNFQTLRSLEDEEPEHSDLGTDISD
jgi:hypothetical protein